MNTKRLYLFFSIFFLSFSISFAQNEGRTVSLVVTGEGQTKEEATKFALRSAIEQAFGTFVSANTEVLNDEVVADEIVTISSGNIQKYEEIDYTTLDGISEITLKVVVSIGKLVSYAQNKGMNAELAGATFAMNKKLRKLNKENERVAIEHLSKQLHEIAKNGLYDFSLEVDEPRNSDQKEGFNDIKIKIKANANNNAQQYMQLMRNTVKQLALTDTEIEEYSKANEHIFYIAIQDTIYCTRNPLSSFGYLFGVDKIYDVKIGFFPFSTFSTECDMFKSLSLFSICSDNGTSLWTSDLVCTQIFQDYHSVARAYDPDIIDPYLYRKNNEIYQYEAHEYGKSHVHCIYACNLAENEVVAYPGSWYARESFFGYSKTLLCGYRGEFYGNGDIKKRVKTPKDNSINIWKILNFEREVTITLSDEELSQINSIEIKPVPYDEVFKQKESVSSKEQAETEEVISSEDTAISEKKSGEEETASEMSLDEPLELIKTKTEQAETEEVISSEDTAISEKKSGEEETASEMSLDEPLELIKTKPDKLPEFPGGELSMAAFLKDNLKYPAIAYENDLEERIIIIFAIDKHGNVRQIREKVNEKAILSPKLKEAHDALVKEAIRVVGLMPKWKPAEYQGETVATQNVLPFTFRK